MSRGQFEGRNGVPKNTIDFWPIDGLSDEFYRVLRDLVEVHELVQKQTVVKRIAVLPDLSPVLRTGEAIVTGEAAQMPLRCRIALPPEEHRPQSRDPEVATQWALKKRIESYKRVVASWRSQSTIAVAVPVKIERKPVKDETPGKEV